MKQPIYRKRGGRKLTGWVCVLVLLVWGVMSTGVDFHTQEAKADQSKKGKVNLNTCSKRELIKRVPGMTSQKAERIIKGRPYSKIYDLITKKVLTKKELSRIREWVTVRDP